MRSVTSPPPAHSSTHPQHGKPWKVTLKTSPPPSVTIYLYACAKVLRPWLPATESSQSPRDLSRGPPPPGSAGHRHSEASSSGHQTPQKPPVWHPSGPRCKGPGEDRDLLGNLDFQANMGKTRENSCRAASLPPVVLSKRPLWSSRNVPDCDPPSCLACQDSRGWTRVCRPALRECTMLRT